MIDLVEYTHTRAHTRTSNLNKERENGITLIALVITIIVLLILSGVTIITLTEENRLLEKASIASEKIKIEGFKEEIQLALLEEQTKTVENLGNEFSYENVWNTLRKNDSKLEVTKNAEDNSYTILYKGYYFKIDEKNNVTYIEEIKEEIGNSRVLSYKIKDNNENTTKKYFSQLTDLTGNGNNATLYNIETTEEGDGIIFNGTSSYAQLDLQQELVFPITLEIDLKCPEKLTGSLIFLEPNYSKVGFGIWGTKFVFAIGTKQQTVTVPNDFYDGNLKHIVITYNSLSDFEIYINGTKLEKNTSTDYWSSGVGSIPYLGRRSQGDYFKGELYKLRVYNRILLESEINGTEDKSNLILEYDMKNNITYEIVPNKIKDMTNNGNDAIFYNSKFNDKKDGIIFDGASSYAQLYLQQELTFPMTIEMTLKTTVKQSNSLIYLEPQSLTAFGMYNNYFVFVINQYSKTVQIPDDFYDGNLKHIIIIYNTLTDFELYINGQKIEQSTTEHMWNTGVGTVPYLGRRAQGNYFNGTIHEFNIYNKVFNENEINSQFKYVKENY